MKKLLILSLVFVLLAVSALPAVAKRATTTVTCDMVESRSNQRYALAGRVQIIDKYNEKVTVLVAVGNVLAEPCVGHKVVISVMEDTILKFRGGDPIDFSDLEVGDKISSRGYIYINDAGEVVWEAVQITQGALLISK